MAEDEEGYRKLIDQKKDKRLAFLLSQTDEYIASLTEMVRQHKEEQANKKREEERRKKRQQRMLEPDRKVTVMEPATGKKLKGENAPTFRELQEWLKTHPGWEMIDTDDEGKSNKNFIFYYLVNLQTRNNFILSVLTLHTFFSYNFPQPFCLRFIQKICKKFW